MSLGLGSKAPKARHSVAAAVRPWIRSLEMKSRPAGPAFCCAVIRDLMPHLRRSTVLCFDCPRAHARGYLMTVRRTSPWHPVQCVYSNEVSQVCKLPPSGRATLDLRAVPIKLALPHGRASDTI